MVCNKTRIFCFENSQNFSSNRQGGIVTVDKEPDRANVIRQLFRKGERLVGEPRQTLAQGVVEVRSM